ncbi:MAG: heavy metal-binding domain-containing protein [Cocleimonas sp.]|nr:heavy metal-binding domain-containing protein [Cocleimonas sp.]
MYQLIFILILLVVTYFIGTYLEKKHYTSIVERERKFNQLPAIAIKTPPSEGNFQQQLVLGSVTISVDYFKRFLAALHNFFGGRVTSYETLLDRARREALLRMKESAAEQNATLVLNIKYETASIYKGSGKSVGSVEVLAYGTAMIPEP